MWRIIIESKNELKNFAFYWEFYLLKCLHDLRKAKIVVAASISALISVVECQDDVSSHLKQYHLSSEILKFKFILFRSDHLSLETRHLFSIQLL